jgi:hypothetical protein
MLIETFIAVGSLALALPSKRREGSSENRICIVSTDSGNSFQLSSGPSLEANVKSEIEDIDGVKRVVVVGDGTDYTVTVRLKEMEFSVFEKVIAKEIELFDQYPNKNFKFDILPESMDDPASLLNAP